jgi:nucleoid DNA-binding protein
MENSAMTKAELVSKIHANSGLSTKVKSEAVLDATIAAITECLAAGDAITLTGFGSFKVVKRAPRKGRNPRTGKEISIPATTVVKFTPGKTLKDSVK